MYGINDLKEKISVTEDHVECPVRGCKVVVERQRKQSNPKDERFKCPKHKIFVSPSTFIYESELSNLLWCDQSDLKLFNDIKMVKRESRIDHENSEDAVSWNVFRFLERNNLLLAFAKSITGINSDYADMIWWSYYQKENDSWSYLNKARIEFFTKRFTGIVFIIVGFYYMWKYLFVGLF